MHDPGTAAPAEIGPPEDVARRAAQFDRREGPSWVASCNDIAVSIHNHRRGHAGVGTVGPRHEARLQRLQREGSLAAGLPRDRLAAAGRRCWLLPGWLQPR